MSLDETILAGFSGSDKLYKHWTGNLHYTEGIKYLAEAGEAYWLLDIIAAAQLDQQVLQRPMLQEIQFWMLQVHEDRSAHLICVEDRNRPAAYEQKIPWTDFPLPSLRIWVETGAVQGPLGSLRQTKIAMLPNER